MSSSSGDDSSYASVIDERIGGIVDDEEEEQSDDHDDEIAAAAGPSRAPRANNDDRQSTSSTRSGIGGEADNDDHQSTSSTRNGIGGEAAALVASSLRQVFPSFFFPCPETHGLLLHLNTGRRGTWGQHQVIKSTIRATLFRVVVAVFHMSEKSLRYFEQEGGDDSTATIPTIGRGEISLTNTSSTSVEVASVPMDKVVQYLVFLARECNIWTPEQSTYTGENLWQYFFPALDEASKQPIAGKSLIRHMDDAFDPIALEVDLSACRSISIREWKIFLGIPDPVSIELTDVSPDTIGLMEWWKPLERIIQNAAIDTDQQSLHDFLVAYCKTIDEAAMKHTCRGMTSNIGCIRKRKCGLLLDILGHHPSARSAYFNGTTRRLVAYDLTRVFGNMKLSIGFNAAALPHILDSNDHETLEIGSGEGDNDATTDSNLNRDDSSLRTSQGKYIQGALQSDGKEIMQISSQQEQQQQQQQQAEVGLFPSDDDEDNKDQNIRIYRRLKRGINAVSNGKKKLKSGAENNSNRCEVSQAWQDAQAVYQMHSDQDEDDSM